MKKATPLLIATLALAVLSAGQARAQRSYLDAVLQPCKEGVAAYYMEPGGTDAAGGYLAQIHSLDGKLKAQGRYADPERRIPDGRFTYFFPNGKVESEGAFVMGRKDGIWKRNDKWGRPLAEKVYDNTVMANLVYTMAQAMPQFPGGEKAMVRYLKDKVGRTSGNVMASFIVEKDGRLSEVKVTGVQDPKVADQVADAFSTAPRWEAGTQDGQPVRVQMHVPLK